MALGEPNVTEADEHVFRKMPPSDAPLEAPVRLVVFDYDRTLTLETHNSIINDYVSGWKGQIDPWRILSSGAGPGWDTYGDKFSVAGMRIEELQEEFNQGKDTSQAYMQQNMQDFLRSSFNDGERKNVAIPRTQFLQEEVCDPSKRLYYLKRMLETVRRGLDQQTPKGKMVIMTYNTSGAIFVLNTLIHADLSHYFDAVHSHMNAVEKVDGVWKVVKVSKRGSMMAVQGYDIGKIRVMTPGKLDDDRFGKPDAVERLYRDKCGGVSGAVLVDDEPDNVAAWIERGGQYIVDLDKAPGEHKFTISYIEQAEKWLEGLLCPALVCDDPADMDKATDLKTSSRSSDTNGKDKITSRMLSLPLNIALRKTSAAGGDGHVFRKVPPSDGSIDTLVRLVVFDYDRTLTLETHNSIINDYVSGWKGQIDPWRILSSGAGGWDTYGDNFSVAGMRIEELQEEFNQGKDTSQAYMQQNMQDFLRSSFNDCERKNFAIPRTQFLQEEVCDPSKRLYYLKRMLETVRRGLDQQTPKGKMVIMTYNTSGAIFVLNTLIHADLSHYFDAVHSHMNAVEKVDGVWKVVKVSKRGSMMAVQGYDIGKIRVMTPGKLDDDRFGKPDAVDRLYREHCGGVSGAVLIDDEPDNVAAWIERGGQYIVDLSKAPGEHKFTISFIEQAEKWLEELLCPTLTDQAVDLKDYFRSFDTNGDGKISKEELRTHLSFSDSELDEMWPSIDKNDDGYISYDEFADWVMTGTSPAHIT